MAIKRTRRGPEAIKRSQERLKVRAAILTQREKVEDSKRSLAGLRARLKGM
jgi:hypothetical protein